MLLSAPEPELAVEPAVLDCVVPPAPAVELVEVEEPELEPQPAGVRTRQAARPRDVRGCLGMWGGPPWSAWRELLDQRHPLVLDEGGAAVGGEGDRQGHPHCSSLRQALQGLPPSPDRQLQAPRLPGPLARLLDPLAGEDELPRAGDGSANPKEAGATLGA